MVMSKFAGQFNLMQKLQKEIAKLQDALEDMSVEGSAGGGMVTAVVNGKQEIISIQIDPEVIDPNDVEMLQDLVMAAVNDALARAKNMMNEEMGNLAKGMNIPGISGLF